MFKLVYTKQFYVDIWFIKAHISQTLANPQSAINITNSIVDKSESLCDFPERFPKIKVGNNEYRQMPVNKFNVFYCVDKNSQTVTIARVLYSGMDINQVAIIN